MKQDYDPSATVKLRSGTYIGKRNDHGTTVFRGIPYGKYNGRWKRLLELPDSNELFEAYKDGPACPQVKFMDWYKSADFIEKDETSCYNLAVATSGLQGKKPVLIFIHGGANIAGGYFDPRYDPQFFVDRNPDIVFVVFNYRLGILGTLCLEGVMDDPEYTYAANLTLHDQLAAFRWVKENIANFGGDPDNVTIGGRSSGSASIIMHMCLSESWQYWNRAFCQSGTTYRIRPLKLKHAKAVTVNVMNNLGVSTFEELLKLPAEMLLSLDPFDLNICFTADGKTLPHDLNSTICSGDSPHLTTGKDIFIGCTVGDLDFGLQDPESLEITRQRVVADSAEMLHILTEEELVYYVDTYLPRAEDKEHAKRFLKNITIEQMDRIAQLYLERDPDRNPYFALSDCLNDYSFEFPLTQKTNGLSKHNTVFHYIWSWAPKEIYPLRAFHGLDASFVLNTRSDEEYISQYFCRPETEHMFELAQEMICSFIRTGRPDYKNFKAIEYEPKTRPIMIIDINLRYDYDPRKEDAKHLWEVYSTEK